MGNWFRAFIVGKSLALALVLLFQASPQIPRKTIGNPGDSANEINKNGRANNAVSSPDAIENPISPITIQGKSSNAAPEEKPRHILVDRIPDKDTWDKVYICLTAALVLIGGFTFIAIWIQAKETAKAAEATQVAAVATRDSVGLIQQQIELMQRQTEATEKAADAARDNAIAAKEGAESANKNTEMFISKERARLRVKLDKLKLVEPILSVSKMVHSIDFSVSIYGQTPAYVVSSGCSAYVRPKEGIGLGEEPFLLPIYNLPAIVNPSDSPSKCNTWILEDNDVISEIKADKLFIEVKGNISYKDVFDRERYTKFRFVWKFADVPVLRESSEYYGEWHPCGTSEDNQTT